MGCSFDPTLFENLKDEILILYNNNNKPEKFQPERTNLYLYFTNTLKRGVVLTSNFDSLSLKTFDKSFDKQRHIEFSKVKPLFNVL